MVRTAQAYEVRDEAGARALAEHVVSRSRRVPVAVVTVSADADAPYVDVDELLADVGDLVEVHVLPSGRISYVFADHMPPDCQVWGGAARAYPVGTEWVVRPSRAPLHLAYDAAHGARVLPLLSADLTSMAHAVGLVLPATPRLPQIAGATGEVKGLTAGRALVRLENGTIAVVAEELLVPGVTIERLLRRGMQVSGAVESGRLDLRAAIRSPDDALAGLAPGSLVPARVDAVTARSVTLALHPGLAVDVDQAEVTTNELDELTDLFTVGDVVTVRLLATAPDWRLRLWDVDDDEQVSAAPALLAGGPPWLELTPLDPVDAVAPDVGLAALPVLPHVLDGPQEPGPVDTGTSPSSSAGSVEPPPGDDTTTTGEAPPAPAPNPLSVFGRFDTPVVRRPVDGPASPVGPAAPRPSTAPTVTPELLDRPRHSGRAPGGGPPPTAPRPPAPAQASPPAVRPVGLPRADPAVALEELRRLTAEQRDELRGLRAERRQLVAHNQQLEDRLDALERQLRDTRARRRSQGQQPRRASTPAADERCFLDAEQQLRHEVLVTWARHVGPHDKAQWPLRDYDVGPEFLPTLERLEGVPRAKVLDVVVDVVTGRIREMVAGRQPHQLREGAAGSSYRRGPRGETYWRVALQVNSPSARRLHYMTHGSLVTLLSVGVHDDFLP